MGLQWVADMKLSCILVCICIKGWVESTLHWAVRFCSSGVFDVYALVAYFHLFLCRYGVA